MTADEVFSRVKGVIPTGSSCKKLKFCPFMHYMLGNKCYCWLLDQTHEGTEKRCGINVE